jgi:hypothetical protein
MDDSSARASSHHLLANSGFVVKVTDDRRNHSILVCAHAQPRNHPKLQFHVDRLGSVMVPGPPAASLADHAVRLIDRLWEIVGRVVWFNLSVAPHPISRARGQKARRRGPTTAARSAHERSAARLARAAVR